MGAAFGGALGGFGNSSVGRSFGKAVGNAVNKGVGKLPFGQYIQRAGQTAGNGLRQLYRNASNDVASMRRSLSVNKADPIELGKIKITAKEAELYRRGTFAGNSNVKGEQWAPENPLSTPDYSQKYGLPLENSGNPDWVVKGHIVGEYGQGPAPRSYNNPTNMGGATEIRINNPDDVQLDWFHMPDD